jgi:hypothetical protein
MGAKLGLDGRLYRNTGTYASPTWNEVKNVRDLSISLEAGEASVTTRGNNGWEAVLGTLKKASVEFQMVWDSGDADVQAFRDAFLDRDTIECAVMDGDIAESGTEGLRATFVVLKFARSEALEEGMLIDVSIKPAYSANAPEWMTVS